MSSDEKTFTLVGLSPDHDGVVMVTGPDRVKVTSVYTPDEAEKLADALRENAKKYRESLVVMRPRNLDGPSSVIERERPSRLDS